MAEEFRSRFRPRHFQSSSPLAARQNPGRSFPSPLRRATAVDLRSIFVGNLPASINKDQIAHMFGIYGFILDIEIVQKPSANSESTVLPLFHKCTLLNSTSNWSQYVCFYRIFDSGRGPCGHPGESKDLRQFPSSCRASRIDRSFQSVQHLHVTKNEPPLPVHGRFSGSDGNIVSAWSLRWLESSSSSSNYATSLLAWIPVRSAL